MFFHHGKQSSGGDSSQRAFKREGSLYFSKIRGRYSHLADYVGWTGKLTFVAEISGARHNLGREKMPLADTRVSATR